MKRKDGTRYRGADMLYTIVPFIMVKRSDACNALTVPPITACTTT